MKNRFYLFIIFLIFSSLAIIYYPWFIHDEIIGGDWPYYFDETIKGFPPFVPSWSSWQGNGLGGMDTIYFLNSFQFATFFIKNFFHLPWVFVYKVFWFGVFLLLSFFSVSYLIKKLFPKMDLVYLALGGFFYTTNTYILMVVGGGQMGVALAYSLVPLVLAVFINLITLASNTSKFRVQSSEFRASLIAGLVLSLQVLFDPRLAYITMVPIVLYVALHLFALLRMNSSGKEKMHLMYRYGLYLFTVPIGITVLLHMFWILPLIIIKQDAIGSLGEAYTASDMVRFLSFANFSDSLSLLQPNWPENVFGKTYFMRPQFLVLPLFAYVSLFFLSLKVKQAVFVNKTILFFSLIGILGAFLSKGANPPFGGLYIFLFDHVPGFVVFRDPTKWYILIALSYSILIPFSAYCIYTAIKVRYVSNIFLLALICYLFFLLSPALLGDLRGTFKKHAVPQDYIIFKNFLHSQTDFSRTLWVPLRHRFSYFSKEHPPVEAMHLFQASSSAKAIEKIKKAGPDLFSQLSIKYIIVPYDPTGDIFLKDRKYNEKEYQKTVQMLEDVPWLQRVEGFGKIAVFKTPSYYDHFWLSGDGTVRYTMLDTSSYTFVASIKNSQKLIFAENYNPYWQAKISKSVINAKKNKNGLNSFSLNMAGQYTGEIIFSPSKYYEYGRIISFITLLGVLFLLIKYRKQ